MKRSFWHVWVFLLLTGLVLGQTPVKSSPASDALVAAAKEAIEAQKTVDNLAKQANSTLELSQKTLRDQIMAKSKDLGDKLKADKKYAPMLAEIDTLNKQMADSTKDAQTKYQQQAGPLNNKIAQDNALVDGLIPVVRKENGLPESSVFDKATQTWSEPKK